MKRNSTPSFVLELEVSFSQKLLDKCLYGIHEKSVKAGTRETLDKKCRAAVSVYNTALGEALKRLHKLQHDRERQELLEEYRKAKKEEADLSCFKDRFNAIQECVGFSEYSLHDYVIQAKHHFDPLIGIDEAQKLATRAFQAVNKILPGTASHVHFKPSTDDISIEGKSGKSTLKYIGNRCIQFGRGNVYPLIVKKKDTYAVKALANRVKYVRLIRKTIRGKQRYYAQLVLEGIPPKTKNLSYGRKNARVGIDEGTTTMAVVSDKEASLNELAPGTAVDEKELRLLNRAIDRSKRATNPGNYNDDGTVKKGRLKWNISNNCRKLYARRKELYRRNAAIRREKHGQLANHIVSLGTDIRVETMRISALARKAKEVAVNKKNGKYMSRKRYGKTIMSRAPAMLMSIVDRKLGYIGRKVSYINTSSVKASQYDHKTGLCRKKQLGDRWHEFADGTRVQRDLYSGFLIQNTTDDLEHVDRNRCMRKYKNFKELQDKEVSRLKKEGNRSLLWYVA